MAAGNKEKDKRSANDDEESKLPAKAQGDEQVVGNKRSTRNTNQKTIGDFFPTKKNRSRAPVKSVKEHQNDSRQRSSDDLESGDEPKIDFAQPPEKLPSGPRVKEIRGTTQTQEEPDDMNQAAALLQSLSSTMKMEVNMDDSTNAEIGNDVTGSAEKRSTSNKEMTCPPISDTWAWKPSCHAGLLTYHDGRKRWYHCTRCVYFNDRLYHSKMHFQRIHVKQGKSMPRKRKYVDPAGSNAAYAAQLPPQHVQQPYSRVRQPGDKWLKTAANDAVSNGFRYQSVKDTHNQHMDDTSSAGTASPTNSTNSDEVELSQEQKEDIERNLGLQKDEIQIYCFEDHQKALTQACEKAMKLSSYEAVVSFESPEGLLAPSKEPAKSNKKPPAQLNIAETSIAISGPMEKTWWWHRPGGMGSDENGQRYDSSSESSQVVLAVEERFQWQAGNFMGNAQAQVKLEDSDVTLDGGISAATALAKKDERAMPNGSKSPAQTSALLDDNTSSVENGKGAKRKLQFHQGGKQGTAVTEGGVKAKAKRMWRRWEPAEDEALKQAVRMHGTKDWISIQSAMKTDRSIKQLQDHWNDLKHDRKHNKN